MQTHRHNPSYANQVPQPFPHASTDKCDFLAEKEIEKSLFQFSLFNFHFSLFNFQFSLFNFQFSLFNFQFSIFNFQFSINPPSSLHPRCYIDASFFLPSSYLLPSFLLHSSYILPTHDIKKPSNPEGFFNFQFSILNSQFSIFNSQLIPHHLRVIIRLRSLATAKNGSHDFGLKLIGKFRIVHHKLLHGIAALRQACITVTEP